MVAAKVSREQNLVGLDIFGSGGQWLDPMKFSTAVLRFTPFNFLYRGNEGIIEGNPDWPPTYMHAVPACGPRYFYKNFLLSRYFGSNNSSRDASVVTDFAYITDFAATKKNKEY